MPKHDSVSEQLDESSDVEVKVEARSGSESSKNEVEAAVIEKDMEAKAGAVNIYCFHYNSLSVFYLQKLSQI